MGLPKECSPLSRWKVVMVWAYRRHLPEMENEDNALQALPAGMAISAAPDGGDDFGILSPPSCYGRWPMWFMGGGRTASSLPAEVVRLTCKSGRNVFQQCGFQ